MHDLQSNEIRLASLVIPAGLSPPITAGIRSSIDEAFVFAFRCVMLICAGLSLTGASFAWRMIAAKAHPAGTSEDRASRAGS
jgi:hypothetical protein